MPASPFPVFQPAVFPPGLPCQTEEVHCKPHPVPAFLLPGLLHASHHQSALLLSRFRQISMLWLPLWMSVSPHQKWEYAPYIFRQSQYGWSFLHCGTQSEWFQAASSVYHFLQQQAFRPPLRSHHFRWSPQFRILSSCRSLFHKHAGCSCWSDERMHSLPVPHIPEASLLPFHYDEHHLPQIRLWSVYQSCQIQHILSETLLQDNLIPSPAHLRDSLHRFRQRNSAEYWWPMHMGNWLQGMSTHDKSTYPTVGLLPSPAYGLTEEGLPVPMPHSTLPGYNILQTLK